MNVFSKELLLRIPEMLRERTRELNQGPIRKGAFVLYWMRTAVRGHENPALDAAIEAANLLQVPVFVYHGISERYPHASDRHHQFMLEGARDAQRELQKKGIGYLCHVERKGERGAHLTLLVGMSSLMVTENMPTPQLQRWVATLRKTYKTVQWLVDTNCIVPMNLSRRRYDDPENFLEELRSARHRRLGLPWLAHLVILALRMPRSGVPLVPLRVLPALRIPRSGPPQLSVLSSQPFWPSMTPLLQ